MGGFTKASRSASRTVSLLAALLVMVLALGLLGAGLVYPAVAITATSVDQARRVMAAIPDDVEVLPLSQKSWIYASSGELLATFYAQNREQVPLDQISQAMKDAVVALEDKRFWEHGGVDLRGMGRALVSNQTGGGTQGASTLTQQYVKNLLIERAFQQGDVDGAQEAREVSYARKIKEIRRAVSLEKRLSKEQILEGYLNIAQFGPSVYGVESAAMYYFGLHASELDALHAATIAAITQLPNGLDPVKHPEQNQARRDQTLDDMAEQGYISTQERDQAKAVNVADSLKVTPTASGCSTANQFFGSAYFCDYVVYTIRNSEAFGKTRYDRDMLLHRGGLRITTTLDPRAQWAADMAVSEAVPLDDPSGVGMAITAIEPGTGKVLAMAQNRRYPASSRVGERETTVNYNADKAYGGSTGFQPGSTFKPFILAEWLSAGHSLTETFDGGRSNYADSRWRASGCTDSGRYRVMGDWNVKNAGKKKAGKMNALYATQWSVNTGFVAMESKLDLCSIKDRALALGAKRADGGDFQAIPSMVLGANEVSPLSMAGAYASFAAQGNHCEPLVIESMVGPDGQAMTVPKPTCNQAIDPGVAADVTKALTGVVNGGTGTGAQLPDGRPHAGKTGTTDGNVAAWFTGYTGQIAASVWMGFPDSSQNLEDVTVNGQYYGSISGGQVPATAWNRFMSTALDDVAPAPLTGA
jgi:membrane peptidoglycan carboxypeptidase